MDQPKISILHDDPCELGEGPGYDPLTSTIWWFDIVTGRLFEKPRAGGPAAIHPLGQMASALAVIDAGRQLIATETGLFIRDRKTGHTVMHQPIEADNPVTRSNDARVHPAGAFWIGTMGKKSQKGAGSIYWYRGRAAAHPFHRHFDHQFDLLLAGRAHQLFRRYHPQYHLASRYGSADRPAHRRARGLLPAQGRRRH